MPTEPANLIAARAWEEAQIVDLERLHAQWTFGQFISAIVETIHGCCQSWDDTNFLNLI
jgi:hypothetical protein